MSKKFRLVEEQCFYKEYEIEAESFEDAYNKWQENTDEVDSACSEAEWEPCEQVELYRIDDIEDNDWWYCN